MDIPESAGVLISEKEIETGLEGQFRVLHPLLDSKGVMRYFGSWGGKAMFAAKRYKKDPGGGWDMEERDEIGALAGPARSAATNRHARLLAPYFQDCLMQEKAAEFGRAFNKVLASSRPALCTVSFVSVPGRGLGRGLSLAHALQLFCVGASRS